MLIYCALGIIISLLLLVFLLLTSLLIHWLAPREGFLRIRVAANIPAIWAVSSLCGGMVLWQFYWIANSTYYSTHYSEQRFRKVRAGMSERQVLELLGSPLGKWKPYQYTNYLNRQHYVGYAYSKSESGEGDYEVRQINFDQGKVAEVRRYRYYD